MVKHAILEDYVNWIDCQYWYINNNPPFIVEPHCHGQYEFILALTDNILHRVNGVLQRLVAGTILLIRPDDIHEFISIPDKKLEFICFSFKKEALERFFLYMDGTNFPKNKLLNSPMPPMCRLSKYETEHLYIKILNLDFKKIADKDRINRDFRLILCEIFSHFCEDSAADYSENDIPEWFERTCTKMKMFENFSKGLPKMIELSGKTPEHLSRTVKKYYGITPSEFINNIRLNFAAKQLLTTSASILDICYECGFESTAYFHKKFKERFGYTPLKFRKKSI